MAAKVLAVGIVCAGHQQRSRDFAVSQASSHKFVQNFEPCTERSESTNFVGYTFLSPLQVVVVQISCSTLGNLLPPEVLGGFIFVAVP